MALFDWMAESTGTVVEGEGVILRPPRYTDYVAWANLRDASRAYLQPWEPAWPEDDLSRLAFRRRMAIYGREMEQGNAWPFFIFDADGDTLLGAITLSNVRRGVAEVGTLGYWIGERAAGQGYGTAATRAMLAFAFGPLNLHRVEAACVPDNLASRRVLEKAGFVHEGMARAYLKINGVWADHLLFGCVNDEVDRSDTRPLS
ncbi:GNAT family protein [uncultured Brevundimonas sp.]|uniref:GNAT family N-acetyltransferase n=1 Tax=uncultured Brevundimonas sp. TaxID=213418 RepID=UPI0030ED767C|tara:strand:+ start:57407 stop:58012 length:606 start_codon:yes stop_codon:yes gene_type:complete